MSNDDLLSQTSSLSLSKEEVNETDEFKRKEPTAKKSEQKSKKLESSTKSAKEIADIRGCYKKWKNKLSDKIRDTNYLLINMDDSDDLDKNDLRKKFAEASSFLKILKENESSKIDKKTYNADEIFNYYLNSRNKIIRMYVPLNMLYNKLKK